MAKRTCQNRISVLCLIIFLLLAALSILQHFGWLPLRNWGVMLVYALVFFLPMLLYVKRRGKKGKEMMRLRGLPVKYIPFTIGISVAICMICGILNVLGYLAFSSWSTAGQNTALFDFTTQNPLVLFLTMVLLPAVTEELLLRGIALSEYEQYGTARAVVLTALIFALFHANPVQMLSLFVAGICYALLTLLFDSIWPALMAHMLNNGAALLLSYYNNYLTYILEDPLFLIFAVIAIFLILIGVLKMLEKVISDRGSRGKLRYLHRRSKKSPWRSISLWIFAAGCILKMMATYFI